MNPQELKSSITEAIAKSQGWHTNGWKTTFGPRNVEVNNLEEAEKLPRTFNNRLEAISYWNNVKNASEEVVEWGNRALASLEKNDMRDVEDSVYCAVVIERPVLHGAPTWYGVFEKCK